MPVRCRIFNFSLYSTWFYRNEAFTSFTTYGFAIASASTADTTVVVHGVLDSSLTGGTTPVQVVRTPLPAAARMVNGQMKFDMQLFLDHSMTEVSNFVFVFSANLSCLGGFAFETIKF